MTEPIDLLVLSVSVGNGHVRAAQALVETAALRKPACRAVHIDAMTYTSAAFRKLYTDWYIQLVNRAPEVWSYLHHKSDATPHSAATQRLRCRTKGFGNDFGADASAVTLGDGDGQALGGVRSRHRYQTSL